MEESRAATPSKQRLLVFLYFVLLIFLFANSFFLHAFFQTWNHLGPDWPIFHSAGQALSQGESPYPSDLLKRGPTQPDGTGWQDYIYPPLFARMVWLLSPLGPFWSMKVYLLLCLLLYFGLLFPRWESGSNLWTAFALQFALFFSWGPVIQNYRMGQSDFIALFLFAAAWKFLWKDEQGSGADDSRKTEWLAGLLIGISFGIKLTPALVVPLFLVAGRWRIVCGFGVTACLSAFLPDPATSYEYFTRVLPTLVSDLSIMEGRPALHLTLARLIDSFFYGFFRTGLPSKTLSDLGILASGSIFALILFSVFRIRTKVRTSDLLLMACFLPPIFAANLRHHYALALLPAMVGIKRIVEAPSNQRWIRLGFLLLALLPTLYYTLPVRMLGFLYGEEQALNLNHYITLGQLAAMVLLWPYLLRSGDNGFPGDGEQPKMVSSEKEISCQESRNQIQFILERFCWRITSNRWG